ncbi:MAG: anthranilate synthase component I [Syntrophorhabdaceae bacterium]|nr:anthranilate synthase component I [Syntrophorhabdaceae bacterium]
MKKTLTYKEFLNKRHKLTYQKKEFIGDLDTPLSCYIKLKQVFSKKPSFLLESVEQKERLGRFSIIGFEPFLTFKSIDKKVILNGLIEDEFETDNPFYILKDILKKFDIPSNANGLGCFGGATGHVNYDMVRFFEKIPDISKGHIDTFDMYFVIPEKIIVFDNFTRKIHLVNIKPDLESENHTGLNELYKIICESVALKRGACFTIKELHHVISKKDFETMVKKAKEYIYRGDIIQVVLSQRFEIETDIDSISLYRALRIINPSPYMFLLEYPEYSLIGSSPETMVRLEGSDVEVRPIAGTRKRGKTNKEDEELEKELLSDEKELAEHTMLVDLGRNDVGRIASIGTVNVSELMNIERYSHVMHLVSSVKGKIKDGLDAFDVFRATFPAGTVTGAPKIRAMEIIEELEREKRGFYAGAVGYFALNGDMDFCIAIRTFLKKDKKVYIQAGAGVVADSVPEREYMETIYKAQGLIKSIMEIKEIIG